MNDDEPGRKERIAGVFDRAASGYGRIRYFPPFGRRLVELAHLRAGAKVLDVASGRGAILIPAAERVGPQGEVIGIDLSAGMVQETCAEVEGRGLANVHVYQMDAENLEFSAEAFDYVLCGFALSFFPHLSRALSGFRRVLKPHGCLAVTTWGGDDERWRWYDELVTAYGAILKLRSQSLDRREELHDVLAEAGFANIQVVTAASDMAFADEEEWWLTQWSISSRAGLERLEPEKLARFKAEAFEKIQALKQSDGFHYEYQVHFGLAFNPGDSQG